MHIFNKSFYVIAALSIMLLFTGCSAEVGSEKWCQNMKEKPKGDWTASEAAEYTKHCVFK